MEHHSEQRARLTLDSAVPFAYRATLDVHLHEGCLNLDLHVTHLDESANWYGLGLHPYFPRYPDTKLYASARNLWLAGMGGYRRTRPGCPNNGASMPWGVYQRQWLITPSMAGQGSV